MRAPDQCWPGQSFVHHNLGGAQDALFFTLGVSDAFLESHLGGGKDGFHDRTGGVDKALQPLAVGVHVLHRALCDPAVGCRLRHRWRNLHHQARIERLGDQVLRAESQLLAGVSGGHHLALLGLGQFGDGVYRRDFHLHRDRRCTCVQRTPKNVGETQNVVDLIGIVGATGGDDRVVAYRLDFFRQDFRRRIGQRKYQRSGCHLANHVGFQHAASRQTQKDVGTFNDFTQRAGRSLLGEDNFVFIHQFGATLIDHARQIGDINILARDAQLDQQSQTGQRRRPSTRGDQFDGFGVFADNFQAIQDRRTNADRRAMLVIMEDRDLHAFTQLAFNVEAVWRLDIFQVDAAEGGLQRGDDVNQFVEVVLLIDFNVKHIDAGKLLEQHALAFHHRLGG